MKWFEEVFLQRQSPGNALLILDGHIPTATILAC